MYQDAKKKAVVVYQPISGRVNRASATEPVDLGAIPGGVKPKTTKIGIRSFLALTFSN